MKNANARGGNRPTHLPFRIDLSRTRSPGDVAVRIGCEREGLNQLPSGVVLKGDFDDHLGGPRGFLPEKLAEFRRPGLIGVLDEQRALRGLPG